tara:strand:+ start:255 stop:470 length:216 start_codon:yes stop_codon:yes gene_type:complete
LERGKVVTLLWINCKCDRCEKEFQITKEELDQLEKDEGFSVKIDDAWYCEDCFKWLAQIKLPNTKYKRKEG